MTNLFGDKLLLLLLFVDVLFVLAHALDRQFAVVFNDNVGVFPNCCCPVVFVATNMIPLTPFDSIVYRRFLYF